jgi:zinc protease
MDVLAAILGEAGRRLQTEIVEHRGLASDVRVTYTRLTDTGFWKVSAAAPADKIQPLLDIVREEIRQIRETPLADADLDKAKAYLRGSARLSLESSTGQAQRLADGAALGYYEPLEGYLERIMATTPADVHAVANKYLDPDALTVVILRPQAP